MDRRTFIASVTLGILAAPLAAEAQPAGKIVRIGRLSPLSAEVDSLYLDAFRKGLSELGWVEGKTFTVESRFAGGKSERLAELAAELVRQRVDLILTGSNQGALAARKATSTIPIVMLATQDPVTAGLVASLARPGGNVTGMTETAPGLPGKVLELLTEVAPGAARVALPVSQEAGGRTSTSGGAW